MTAKKKAKELVSKFYVSDLENVLYGVSMAQAKLAALIVANEIIDERFCFRKMANKYNNERINFWYEVKEEIEKL